MFTGPNIVLSTKYAKRTVQNVLQVTIFSWTAEAAAGIQEQELCVGLRTMDSKGGEVSLGTEGKSIQMRTE
jgi:hypothetical protein